MSKRKGRRWPGEVRRTGDGDPAGIPSVRLTPGGNTVPRPAPGERCRRCGEALGYGYPACPGCYDAVERLWEADWAGLLAAEGIAPGGEAERELARVVVAERERRPWTMLDAAMARLRCESCGAELGGGPPECGECAFAFGHLWGLDDSDPPQEGVMWGNGHALRVGRYILRHPHRHSANTVAGWRATYPRLLTGILPTTAEAQRGRALLNKYGPGALRGAR